MATSDLATWLRSLGLERYEETFRANDVDADVLPELSDADLEKLGISLGHRRKLLKAIADLRTGDADRSEPPPTLAAAATEVEGERRQVTVLFCDLAGYTALSRELDAEEVHALLERFFERVDGIVERYRRHHRQAHRRLRDGGVRGAGRPRQRRRAGGARRARHPGRRAGALRGARADDRACTSGSPPARSSPAARAARRTAVHRDRRLGEPRLAPDRRRGERRDPDLRRGAPRAAAALRLRRGQHARGQGPRRAGPGLAPARRAARRPRGGPAVRRPARRARASSRACSAPAARPARARRSSSAARRGSARRAWSRSSRRRRAPRASPATPAWCSTSAPAPARTRSAPLVRSLLGARRRAATRRRGGGRRAGARRRLGRPTTGASTSTIFSTCRSRPPLRALYDAMDNPTRNRGKRATAAALVRVQQRSGGRCSSWSRTCTGPIG